MLIDANGRHTEFRHDALGRLTHTLFANGTATEFHYQGLGQTVTTVDQAGNEKTLSYDSRGRLVAVTLPAPVAGGPAPTTHYAYDETGNLVSQTDALGRTTRYAYDPPTRGRWRGREIGTLAGSRQSSSHRHGVGGEEEKSARSLCSRQSPSQRRGVGGAKGSNYSIMIQPWGVAWTAFARSVLS